RWQWAKTLAIRGLLAGHRSYRATGKIAQRLNGSAFAETRNVVVVSMARALRSRRPLIDTHDSSTIFALMFFLRMYFLCGAMLVATQTFGAEPENPPQTPEKSGRKAPT